MSNVVSYEHCKVAGQCDKPTVEYHGWVCGQGLKHKGPCIPSDAEEARMHDDRAAAAFSVAMREKLAAARARGRSGWNDKADCSQHHLSELLRKHVEKGDPVDVANFAMFLHQRGESILPAPTGEQAGEVVDWNDSDVETLRCLRDAIGKYVNLKKLWVPTIDKMLSRARLVTDPCFMPGTNYGAQSSPVGVPDALADPNNPWRRAVEHAGYLVTAVERYRAARDEEAVTYEEVENADAATDEQVSALEHAQEECTEASRALRSACYEFTKRRDRAMASLEGTPVSKLETPSFQARVTAWMDQCFLPSLYSNMTERGDRLLEEVLELLQATGYDRSRVATLVDYVYGRPAGEPSQEVGGVMVTLAGFCWIAGLDMHADGERELIRITQPEVMAKIRAKQEAKNALHFDTPLPGAAPEVPRG